MSPNPNSLMLASSLDELKVEERSLEPPAMSPSSLASVTRASLPEALSSPAYTSHNEANNLKCDIVVNYLYQQMQERLWISSDGQDQGVVLKKARGQYTSHPAYLSSTEQGFMKAAEMLNARVVITVNTKVVRLVLHDRKSSFVPLSGDLRLQVLPDLSYLPRCQKHQFAAFIADRKQLVVWDDDPRLVLDRAAKIESELLDMVLQDDAAFDLEPTEKTQESKSASAHTSGVSSDLEKGIEVRDRPAVLFQATHASLAIMLTFVALGIGWRAIATEIFVDQGWIRLAFVALAPIHTWLGFFFFQTLVGNLFALVGPISQMKANTKYYSAIPPKPIDRDRRESLPHLTIQMPVFKESLTAVIEPTVKSVKAAMCTYEMQGGTANIFVNDDGMQLLSDDMAHARRDFYDAHNIGWVARPRHNPRPAEGEEMFFRRGKFKKASNMNYAMWVSNRVEHKLSYTSRSEEWTAEDETESYQEALERVIAEDEGRTWAEGNIRIGDYILLVDSDTRVPTDCFLDAVSEMEHSPEVAVLQYASGVMNVTASFFERGITFFTNLVYTQIRFAVANGDVAPFVGHNAILRWSAIQQIAYDCADDCREKYWTESTVSEDFDMALRLQTAGYLVRLGVYAGSDYKEGVSLTVYDELARWEKYSYGCSELVFHPLRHWPKGGPFTPLFRHFVTSCIPLSSKLTIMAYVGTYYALASAWSLTLLNYFLVGWFNGFLDHYYLDSFKIYFAIIVVFTVLGNISLAVLRYRIEEKALVPSIIENVKWIPLLVVFLGGISLHVSQAILSHLFSIDMSWGSTTKEAETTTFFKEIRKVSTRFKFTLIFCVACSTLMVVLGCFAPHFWQINLFVAVFPLATMIFGHFLLPIVLNPSLMLLTW